MQAGLEMFLATWIASVVLVSAEFNLTILHTNDVHARIEEADTFGGPCTPELSTAGECFGGASRVRTMVAQKRKQYPNATLVLDAGDQFQGTVWYFVYGGNVTAEFMNLIGYDAMAIGNHEFDGGVKGLSPFAHEINFPFLASNLNVSNTPELSDVVTKSTVIKVNGRDVGIVGYLTPRTAFISSPETVVFADELGPVQAEIDQLVAKGVKIIIALGHSGYSVDIELAKRLKDVDIVVGGHTNTFLYTGTPPSTEKAEGKYPTVVTSIHTGRDVLVVQDYAFGKYLGELHVSFDDKGEVTRWSGNPILLDKSVAKDSETEELVLKYIPKIIDMKKTVIGEAYVDLLADRIRCRTTECNLGNLITDAVVHENLRHTDQESWTEAGIAIVNAGSFRASSLRKGKITIEKVIFVQPFRNSIDIIEIYGQTLLEMLEFAASKWTENSFEVFGGFLQVSGLQITYDMSRPVGERVVEVLAVCTKCRVPELEPLRPEKIYKVLASGYIINGGEGYSMLPGAVISRRTTDTLDTDVLMNYIKSRSPIITGLQNRIRHLKDINPSLCVSAGQSVSSWLTKLIIPMVYLWTRYIV